MVRTLSDPLIFTDFDSMDGSLVIFLILFASKHFSSEITVKRFMHCSVFKVIKFIFIIKAIRQYILTSDYSGLPMISKISKKFPQISQFNGWRAGLYNAL